MSFQTRSQKMSKAEMLTDDQWSVLEPLFQKRQGTDGPECPIPDD